MNADTLRTMACSDSRPAANTAPNSNASTEPSANAFSVAITAAIRSS